jgi:hypothetical protein
MGRIDIERGIAGVADNRQQPPGTHASAPA